MILTKIAKAFFCIRTPAPASLKTSKPFSKLKTRKTEYEEPIPIQESKWLGDLLKEKSLTDFNSRVDEIRYNPQRLSLLQSELSLEQTKKEPLPLSLCRLVLTARLFPQQITTPAFRQSKNRIFQNVDTLTPFQFQLLVNQSGLYSSSPDLAANLYTFIKLQAVNNPAYLNGILRYCAAQTKTHNVRCIDTFIRKSVLAKLEDLPKTQGMRTRDQIEVYSKFISVMRLHIPDAEVYMPPYVKAFNSRTVDTFFRQVLSNMLSYHWIPEVEAEIYPLFVRLSSDQHTRPFDYCQILGNLANIPPQQLTPSLRGIRHRSLDQARKLFQKVLNRTIQNKANLHPADFTINQLSNTLKILDLMDPTFVNSVFSKRQTQIHTLYTAIKKKVQASTEKLVVLLTQISSVLADIGKLSKDQIDDLTRLAINETKYKATYLEAKCKTFLQQVCRPDVSIEQQVIVFPFTLDFLVNKQLIISCEGNQHRGTTAWDAVREQKLKKKGFSFAKVYPGTQTIAEQLLPVLKQKGFLKNNQSE